MNYVPVFFAATQPGRFRVIQRSIVRGLSSSFFPISERTASTVASSVA